MSKLGLLPGSQSHSSSLDPMRSTVTLQCVSPAWRTGTRRVEKLELRKQCCYQETATPDSHLIILRMLSFGEYTFFRSLAPLFILPLCCARVLLLFLWDNHCPINKERGTVLFQTLTQHNLLYSLTTVHSLQMMGFGVALFVWGFLRGVCVFFVFTQKFSFSLLPPQE